MGKDRFHDVVRTALEKEGWKITADPYEINVDDVDFALEKIEPDRQLYLAIRVPIYESFFQRRFIASAVERYQLRLVIYDVRQEVINRWL